jgi:hypothetical protein
VDLLVADPAPGERRYCTPRTSSQRKPKVCALASQDIRRRHRDSEPGKNIGLYSVLTVLPSSIVVQAPPSGDVSNRVE